MKKKKGGNPALHSVAGLAVTSDLGEPPLQEADHDTLKGALSSEAGLSLS